MRRHTTVIPALAALLALALLSIVLAADGATERVSVASDGGEANGLSNAASVSADGRFITFASDATNLVPDDNNNNRDIFVHDRLNGTTERVSLASDGAEGNALSFRPAISGDGRYVAFRSDSNNLVTDDTNDASDIFVHDRLAGATQRVSIASGGAQGNDDSLTPSISADGRYVTFTSLANNLVPGDANDDRDVFLHDRNTGETELISQATDGTQGNFASGGLGAGPARTSADGRYVVFGSFASTLVTDDMNLKDDSFLRDRQNGTTERVSVGQGGIEGDNHSFYPSVSDDGRYVAFTSAAQNLTTVDANSANDVFLRDLQAGTTVRISDAPGGAQGNGSSDFATISAGGGVIAFESDADNLVAGDGNGATDIFVYRLASGESEGVSISGDGASSAAAISGAGEVVAFQSDATNLVPDDGNGVTDVFVRSDPPPAVATPTPSPIPSPIQLPITGTGLEGDDGVDPLLWGAILLAVVGVAIAATLVALRHARRRHI